MLNYETALALKEAGFPQPDAYQPLLDLKGILYHSGEDHVKHMCPGSESVDEFAYAPTLSELIAACGEKFGGIIRTLDHYNHNTGEIEVRFEAFSSEFGLQSNPITTFTRETPESAVAALYLSLHEKKHPEA